MRGRWAYFVAELLDFVLGDGFVFGKLVDLAVQDGDIVQAEGERLTHFEVDRFGCKRLSLTLVF